MNDFISRDHVYGIAAAAVRVLVQRRKSSRRPTHAMQARGARGPSLRAAGSPTPAQRISPVSVDRIA
jgi:hypothetical protein